MLFNLSKKNLVKHRYRILQINFSSQDGRWKVKATSHVAVIGNITWSKYITNDTNICFALFWATLFSCAGEGKTYRPIHRKPPLKAPSWEKALTPLLLLHNCQLSAHISVDNSYWFAPHLIPFLHIGIKICINIFLKHFIRFYLRKPFICFYNILPICFVTTSNIFSTQKICFEDCLKCCRNIFPKRIVSSYLQTQFTCC